jgi:hypothetical protein
MRSWFQKNVNVGHWIIIITIVVGFISTNAVRVYSGDLSAKMVISHDDEIELNTDFREQGFPFTEEKESQLNAAVSHGQDKNVHMPYSEKVKAFVPRTEFDVVKEDVKGLKDGQTKIYDLLLERLPASE